jgi:hypothetical protein
MNAHDVRKDAQPCEQVTQLRTHTAERSPMVHV